MLRLCAEHPTRVSLVSYPPESCPLGLEMLHDLPKMTLEVSEKGTVHFLQETVCLPRSFCNPRGPGMGPG